MKLLNRNEIKVVFGAHLDRLNITNIIDNWTNNYCVCYKRGQPVVGYDFSKILYKSMMCWYLCENDNADSFVWAHRDVGTCSGALEFKNPNAAEMKQRYGRKPLS